MNRRKWINHTLPFLLISCLIVLGAAGCKKSKATSVSRNSSKTQSSSLASSAGNSSSNVSSVGSAASGITGILHPDTSTAGGGGTGTGTGTGSNNNISTSKLNTGVEQSFNPYASIPANLKGSTVQILLWYTPSPSEQSIYNAFKKKTGIKIQPVVTNYNLYATKLTSLHAAGTPVDVACMMENSFPTFIKQNLVEDVSNGGKAINLTQDKAYDLGVMNQLKWNNKYYAVVLKGSTISNDLGVVLYNADLFSQAHVQTPYQQWKAGKWNWNTLLSDARALTAKRDGTQGYGFGLYNREMMMLSANSNFVKLSTSNGKTKVIGNLTDKNLIAAWTYYNQMVKTYKCDPGSSSDSDFLSGRIAMLGIASSSMQSDQTIAKKMKSSWGAVPFPSPAGMNYIPDSVKGWCIAGGSKNPVAAAYFIRFLCDPNNMSTSIWPTKTANNIAEVFASVSNANKCVAISQHIVGYDSSNDGDFNSLETDLLYNVSASQIPTKLSSWTSKLNGILADVNK